MWCDCLPTSMHGNPTFKRSNYPRGFSILTKREVSPPQVLSHVIRVLAKTHLNFIWKQHSSTIKDAIEHSPILPT